MIILEGADNSGKSTLGEYLSNKLNLPLRHSEKPNPEWTPVEALGHSSRQLRPQSAILDRVYALSEYVYGPICRGASALGEQHQEALLDLYNRPYLIIYCRPHLSTILRNGGRDQMEGVLENHQKIVEEYDRLMDDVSRFSCCQVVNYDWQSITDLPRILDIARVHMKKYRSGIYSSFYLGLGAKA